MKKFLVITCSFFLSSVSVLIAQKKAFDFSIVDTKIQSWIDSGYYQGASIIVVKNEDIVFNKYYGNYKKETVAYIASAGKWLAAATIAAVVDQGKLKWDDPVSKWLPEFKDIKGTATLRQLLSHTSGFPDYQPGGYHPDNYQTLKEAVSHIVTLPADTTPGKVFKYGGLAMQVAGRMAEMACGKSWEHIFQEKIARPLQMQNTHFTPVDDTPGHNPMLGGGARCRLDDYGHFLDMILHNGMFRGKRILSQKSISEMQRDQIGSASVRAGEYVQQIRGVKRVDIYGLGQWRELTDSTGKVTLISSPSWAGAYPWIDKSNNVYGFFLARISNPKNGFSGFFASPVLPILVRKVLND